MRVCVVGSGGREHVLAHVLARTAEVVVTPGNPGIPGSTATPPEQVEADLYVIKTDGLAAGKGVLVTESLDEAAEDVRAKLSGSAFGDAGRTVVVEEGLSGPELSILAVCDGFNAVPLAPAQDFKRALDGDG